MDIKNANMPPPRGTSALSQLFISVDELKGISRTGYRCSLKLLSQRSISFLRTLIGVRYITMLLAEDADQDG